MEEDTYYVWRNPLFAMESCICNEESPLFARESKGNPPTRLKHNCFQETLTNWKKKLEATRKEICAIHQEYWSCWDWRGKIQFTEQSKFQEQSLDTMGFVYNVLLKVGSELHTDFCQLQLCPVSTNSTSCHYLLQGYICSPVEHCRHSL